MSLSRSHPPARWFITQSDAAAASCIGLLPSTLQALQVVARAEGKDGRFREDFMSFMGYRDGHWDESQVLVWMIAALAIFLRLT